MLGEAPGGAADEGAEGEGEGEAAAAGGGVALEGVAEGGHRGEAGGGVAAEGAEDHALHPGGDVGAGGWWPDGAGEDGGGECGEGVAGEGELAEQGLVEGDGEAELVAAFVGGAALELFGGHVRGGAHQHAGAGEGEGEGVVGGVGGGCVFGGGEGGAGEAEVEDLDAAVVDAALDEHGVVGFEVAVDDAGAVGCCEAAAGLGVDAEGVAPRWFAFGPAFEADAADVLHHDVGLAVVLADLDDGDDVGVDDPGHGLGLAEEAGLGVAGGGGEELDRHAAVELGVVGGVDDAHAALAEAVEEGVAADPLGGGLAGEQAGGEQVLHAALVVAVEAGEGEGAAGVGEHVGVASGVVAGFGLLGAGGAELVQRVRAGVGSGHGRVLAQRR